MLETISGLHKWYADTASNDKLLSMNVPRKYLVDRKENHELIVTAIALYFKAKDGQLMQEFDMVYGTINGLSV